VQHNPSALTLYVGYGQWGAGEFTDQLIILTAHREGANHTLPDNTQRVMILLTAYFTSSCPFLQQQFVTLAKDQRKNNKTVDKKGFVILSILGHDSGGFVKLAKDQRKNNKTVYKKGLNGVGNKPDSGGFVKLIKDQRKSNKTVDKKGLNRVGNMVTNPFVTLFCCFPLILCQSDKTAGDGP